MTTPHHATSHADVTRRSFERQRGLFEGEEALFARRAASVAPWLEPLAPDMEVLEVACGAAHVAEQVAPHVRRVVGVDLTPALLESGAARLRAAGVANVVLQEGDAAALPFGDATFDLVVCRTALHHFDDVERAVAEMRRVCRPGGRVVVADMVAPDAAVRDRFDEVHRLLDPSHVRVLLDAELVELLSVHVGPAHLGDQAEILRVPLDLVMTDAADRDAVTSALHDEIAGGPATGFEPTVEADRLVVGFAIAVAHATRGPDA